MKVSGLESDRFGWFGKHLYGWPSILGIRVWKAGLVNFWAIFGSSLSFFFPGFLSKSNEKII